MKTFDVINYLIKNRDYNSYLEIGLDNPEHNFLQVSCTVKESVDPFFDMLIPEETERYLTYRMTSDEMFRNMDEDKKYDIVFVDGGHTEEQCCKDIFNSMKHLNPGGCILVHDCIPYDEVSQRTIRETELWNGDVWKSVYKLNGRNIEFKTVSIEWGMAIIEYSEDPKFEGYCNIEPLDYNRDFSLEALHTISEEQFLDLYKKINVVKNGVPVNLVAHFYLKEEFNEELPFIYKVHFECLRKYGNIFTNSVFVLSVDDNCSKKSINFFKNEIVNLGFNGDLSIKIRKNSAYREAETFKNEVADKLGDLDGLTFFVHGKGISNLNRADVNPDSVIEWIISSYYQMFSNFDYLVTALITENTGICYGPFLFLNDYCLTLNDWYFSGAFQCINTKKLLNYIANKGARVPLLCDRAYAETFLGDIIEFSPFFIRSFKGRYGTSSPLIMYKDSSIVSSYIIGDEYQKYEEFKKEILSKI